MCVPCDYFNLQHEKDVVSARNARRTLHLALHICLPIRHNLFPSSTIMTPSGLFSFSNKKLNITALSLTQSIGYSQNKLFPQGSFYFYNL